jgi:hypothetical protein
VDDVLYIQLLVGHYLNLPVVEEDGSLVAIVDVLKLTYATLEQVSKPAGFRMRDLCLADEYYGWR